MQLSFFEGDMRKLSSSLSMFCPIDEVMFSGAMRVPAKSHCGVWDATIHSQSLCRSFLPLPGLWCDSLFSSSNQPAARTLPLCWWPQSGLSPAGMDGPSAFSRRLHLFVSIVLLQCNLLNQSTQPASPGGAVIEVWKFWKSDAQCHTLPDSRGIALQLIIFISIDSRILHQD